MTLVEKLAFYEWAYGHLAEADSDAGPLGEFVVLLSKLGWRTAGYGFRTRRSEKAPWDLEIDGETIEVKTTFKPKPTPRGKPRWRWTVGEERDSLEGRGPLADKWIFLKADFPGTAGKRRFFDVFDSRWWTAWAVSGKSVRDSGVKAWIGESTLQRMGAEEWRVDFPPHRSAAAKLSLRLAFFTWSYGDVHAAFNSGRFAEWRVMCLIGRRTLRRATWADWDVDSVHGLRLEVKYGSEIVRYANGTEAIRFKIPIRGGERKSDAFVFVSGRAFDEFRLVPTAVLHSNRSYITSAKLDALGYPVLTSENLVRVEAEFRKGNSPENAVST